MANSYGWPDPKVTYNKNAKKIADARAARAAQVAQLHYPMPQAPVTPGMLPPMGQGMQQPNMFQQPSPQQPPVPGFRAGGIVRFDDGGDVELTDEEKQRQAIANAGNIPVPAPAPPPGGALAGSVGDTLGQAPVYGPPAPTYLQAAQQVYAQNPELVSIAAGELQQNNGIANIQQYQQQLAQQQAQQQQYEARQAGTTQVNPVQGGFRAPENPANVQPGPNADMGILDVGKIQQQYDKVNPSIPYVTPAIENYVKPAAGEAINTMFPAVNAASNLLGGPNTGRLVADQIIPSHALDLALTAAPFAGEAARAGRGALENAAVKGLEFKPQATEGLLKGQMASQVGVAERPARIAGLESGQTVAGGALTPQEGAQLRAQAEAAGLTAADWQHSSVLQDQYGRMGADGAVARAKQALEAIGERTTGAPSEILTRYDRAGAQIFPEVHSTPTLESGNAIALAKQEAKAAGASAGEVEQAGAKAYAQWKTGEDTRLAAAKSSEEERLLNQWGITPEISKGVTPPAEVAPPQGETFFHGTSGVNADSIVQNGMRPGSFLTTDPEQALGRALDTGAENPRVVQVTVPREELRPTAHPEVFQTQKPHPASEYVKPTEAAPNLQNPTPALSPHDDLLGRARMMSSQDLRAEAQSLGIPLEGRINKDQLIGEISKARDPQLDLMIQDISKRTSLGINELRTGGDVRQQVNEAVIAARERAANPGRFGDASSRQGASRQLSALEKVQAQYFPEDIVSRAGAANAGKLATPAEMAGVGNLPDEARARAMENLPPSSRPSSPDAYQEFVNSPAGRASQTQREAAANVGVRPGETTSVTTGGAPTTATGGVGQPPTGTGGTGIPPAGGAGATPLKPQNPIQQAGNITSVATQIRLLGGHMLRQGEGAAATHWKEAATAFRAGYDAFKNPGGASRALAEIKAKDALLPKGAQLADVRGITGPRLEKGYGDKLLSQIPFFDRIRGAGSAYLSALRDSLYVTAAERHLRMDPGAPPEALKAIYNTESHVTGHPTLKGNVKEAMGNAQGVGVGWNALAARAQHFWDIVAAPGSPLPWSPTAKGEAVRALMGNIGTMAASTTAASMLGAKVNIPFLGGNRDLTNPYGIKTDFFKPVTTTPDLAYKTVYGTGGSGYDSIIRLFGNAAIDLASQNFTGKNSLESHILNWARGEAGVAPSVLIDLISGSTYNGKPYDLDKLKEEASHGFWERVAPIAAESMIKAYGAWGPEGLARAAPSLGAWEVQTTPTTKTNQGNALLDSDQRDQLLGPILAPLVKPGEDFNALGSREKEAIHAGMNPDALKAERDQKIKDGDPVAIAQFQREDIKNSYQPAFQKLDEALHNGTYTPYEARQLVNATERQMYEKMNAVKFPEGNKDYTPSPIQKAEEGYRSIYDALPKGTNGKPDYDQLQKAQQSYMANIGRSDPELMQRLAANVLPRVNPNDSNIQKMYDQPQMKQAVQAYNQQDDGAKTGWRIENPNQNALLYSGGYVRTLDTPAALQAYKAMGIAGDPEVNFMVGFTKDTATPYSRIQAGSLQPQLQAYQGLNASREEGDFRAQAYLKEHPALNALLWQTGHTSHVYSVPAYESITGHHEAPLASNSPLRSEIPAPAPVGAPMSQVSPLGPDGRTVAQIAGTPYKSDAERNFYFESRGLAVPAPGAKPQASTPPNSGGTGSAFEMDASGRTGPVSATDIKPFADKYGVPANTLALLMNHEGNGAHDKSESGVLPARWGLTQNTARSLTGDKNFDTRSLTPSQAYDLAAKYINTGLEANRGDVAKAFATYYIGQGGVDDAVARGGDWVKNADRIAKETGDRIHVNYGSTSMTDFMQYLGLR